MDAVAYAGVVVPVGVEENERAVLDVSPVQRAFGGGGGGGLVWQGGLVRGGGLVSMVVLGLWGGRVVGGLTLGLDGGRGKLSVGSVRRRLMG